MIDATYGRKVIEVAIEEPSLCGVSLDPEEGVVYVVFAAALFTRGACVDVSE